MTIFKFIDATYQEDTGTVLTYEHYVSGHFDSTNRIQLSQILSALDHGSLKDAAYDALIEHLQGCWDAEPGANYFPHAVEMNVPHSIYCECPDCTDDNPPFTASWDGTF